MAAPGKDMRKSVSVSHSFDYECDKKAALRGALCAQQIGSLNVHRGLLTDGTPTSEFEVDR